MKGMKFEIDYDLMKKNDWETSFGWDQIEIIERYVSHIVERTTEDGKTLIHVYEWIAIGYSSDGTSDFIRINEDDFMEEVAYGIYRLCK